MDPATKLEGGEAILLRLHDSLRDASKGIGSSDVILVAATYLFNGLMLVLAWSTAKEGLFWLAFLALTAVVNGLMVQAFRNSREMRTKLEQQLAGIYRDVGLGQYYDTSILTNYNRHYSLWIGLDVSLASIVFVVSILAKFR